MTPEQVAEARDAILAEHEDCPLCRHLGWVCDRHKWWLDGVRRMADEVIAALDAERVCKRCGGRGSWPADPAVCSAYWSGGRVDLREQCPACGGTGQETP